MMEKRTLRPWTFFSADWLGGGVRSPGAYDEIDRTMFFSPSGQPTRSFAYGPKAKTKFPVVGDWNGDGSATLGLYLPNPNVFVLKNTLVAGTADVTVSTIQHPQLDAVQAYHHQSRVLPQDKFKLAWHTFSTNNDLARDCDGDGLLPPLITDGSGATFRDPSRESNQCRNFVTELTFLEYDDVKRAWLAPVTIDRVWAGTNVAFDFVEARGTLLVAYYNQDRKVTLAARRAGSSSWSVHPQASIFGGWDSHNTLRLGVDPQGFVHLSGNMHAVPLVYFRTRRPDFDVSSMSGPVVMIGDARRETSVTYQEFLNGPAGRLFFMHRGAEVIGFSDGTYWLNAFDASTGQWSSHTGDRPVVTGKLSW
jgi:hypothetical protein